MTEARAPFVAVENPVMHRHGRQQLGGRGPDQYVQPWQHGTPHQKRTGLFLEHLPALQPTCVVEGRERAMANLPATPDRGQLRGRSYVGVLGAMAMQWLPLVLEHTISASADTRGTRDTATMIEEAQAATRTRSARLCFRAPSVEGSFQYYLDKPASPLINEDTLDEDSE